jgi:predicted O-methyltransferase YrrM
MTSIHWNTNLQNSFHRIFNNIITTPTNIIEIGCFEGYGTLKLHELLGTHPNSKITCIDPWDDVYVKGNSEFSDIDPIFVNQYNTFMKNTSKIYDKLIIKRGYSTEELPKLDLLNYDFAYVDGDHSENQVYLDGKLLLPLMKSGSIILFDDYNWSHKTQRTSVGIERFISEYKDYINVIFRGPVQCAIKVN